jgi:hypothetical protein
MRFAIAAALALTAATSLSAQTTQSAPDLATATPIAGNWTYAPTTDGSEAVFANANGIPQLWIQCSRAMRRVSVSRPASAAAPLMSIWTSSQTRSAPASFNPTTGRLTVVFDASDPLLDAVSNSRGRLGFTVSTQPSLVLPAWAEAARVVEDCRG